MYAEIRDTRIFFDIEGAGFIPEGSQMRKRPVGFAVHGGPGSDHSGFKPSYAALTKAMQVVYFDHRGQGRSGRGDPARWTLDENVEDMEALRCHLGCGPIVSIGTSYGGMVAMAHAARYPDAVSHLVLVVTASHGGFIPRAQEILVERGSPEQQALCAKVWQGGFKDEAELKQYYRVMGPLYSLRFDAAAAEDGIARTIHSPEALNRAFRPDGFLRHFDLRPELGRITAPTLILAGRHDWICPPEFSEEIHKLIPSSRLLILEDSSHSMRVDAPERLFGEIMAFVEGP
ncbi:alpha/beta fold hydrolase [Siccirubricoccus sp. KC 17139]|uniref:Alpha/beta fold hydrolase n=1 Tax=Siccirubricoccus soli TaxID=2899147 RepID=A0ABT1D7L9_9PROT|nr:alpha/beta fold hydrolase [Siccirubricoccus soli]MCO6417923.1 alpha/beta fold hydrolase [Siccirubricoccus soli]MCP2684058.1 alpha/beta fold hydrolase [Siccirubricoccus soli]